MGYRARAVTTASLAVTLSAGFGIDEASAREITQLGESGFLRIDYQLQARAGVRDQGPDPTKDENTYDAYVRRNRLSFIGKANEAYGAVVQLEFNGGNQLGDVSVFDSRRKWEFVLLDAFATADPLDFLRVRAGKTKHVLTREVNEGCFDPLSIDRSPFILGPFGAHAPEKSTRDVGLVLWGNFRDSMIQYRVAAMQGNRFGETPDGIGFRYSGRVHVTLFDKEPGIVYRGTYLGKKRVLTLGAGYELQPNAVYSSGKTGAENYSAYTYDVFYEHPTSFGTFTVSGAYLKADFGEAAIRNIADAQGASGERNGFYWKGGYLYGKFQVFGRFEHWSFASLSGVVGQKLTWLVAGLNYFVFGDENLRLTLEGANTRFDKAPAKDFNTVLFQVQAQL